MAFLNLSLLLGSVFVAVPVILHLALRQQPRQLVFPAVQFIKQRQESNRRKLQLRHWLLLLLRCLAVLGLVVALARPTVSSDTWGNWLAAGILAAVTLLVGLLLVAALMVGRSRWLVAGLAAAAAVGLLASSVAAVVALQGGRQLGLGNQEAPVAALMVFDTSPRMRYVQGNRTRLERAQEIALWVLGQLPADSQLAVLDSRPGPVGFSVDLAAAERSIQRLQTTGIPQPLLSVLEQAVELSGQSSLRRQEIYLFTDLTRPAWEDQRSALQERLSSLPNLLLYVIDVGVLEPQNFGLGALQLSAQRMAKNGILRIDTELQCLGGGGQRAVEVHLEEPDASGPMIRDGQIQVPPARLRGRQLCELEGGRAASVHFELQGLPQGTQQGYVAIAGEDGLAVDNRRHFAIEVAHAWPVLIVAPDPVNTVNFVEAIAPYEQRTTERARFECTLAKPADLPNRQLDDFQVVCLLDPPPLPPTSWQQLARFVAAGGGLAVFLGYEAGDNAAAFNVPEAQQLLPGPLGRQWRIGGRDVFLAPSNYAHPVLDAYREIASQVPWNRFPVLRHWGLEGLAPEARVVLRFGNGQPALIESRHQQGRVLTMTTPITEKARPVGRKPWNELVGPDDWPRFVLINEMMDYLADTGDIKLNYLTGQTAALPNSSETQPSRYQLFAPPQETREVTAREGRLTIRGTDAPGAYRLKGTRGGLVIRGFAVNLPGNAGDLRRIDIQQLDRLLGPRRYQLAREPEQIEVGVGRARVGREFYPLLLLVCAVVLGLEHVLANRFYRKES